MCWERLWADEAEQEKRPSCRDVGHEHGREGRKQCMNWLCSANFVLSRCSSFLFSIYSFLSFSFPLNETRTIFKIYIYIYTWEGEREGINEHLHIIKFKKWHFRNTLRPDSIPISVPSPFHTSNLANHDLEFGIYQGLISLLDLYGAHFSKIFKCFFNLAKKSYRMHFEITFHSVCEIHPHWCM